MRHVGQGERPGAHLAGVEHGGHATHDVRAIRLRCPTLAGSTTVASLGSSKVRVYPISTET